MNTLEQLREMTVVVADTGDFESIKKHRPRDATTNPSLLYAAAQLPAYQALVDDAVNRAAVDLCDPSASMGPVLEQLAVNFGKEILQVVEGRVSVEVDATLSFDIDRTKETARRIIGMFEKEGIDRGRILIKIASTWEGIRAAEVLEKEGIHCNLTLLFSFAQAVACAEANVTLISPFVGRILDWHLADRGVSSIPPAEDPGVQSVARIYNYYKKFGYKTEIMGASFRNTGEIIELAGCDLLTISPKLLEQLSEQASPLTRKLCPDGAESPESEPLALDEPTFRWMLNEDAMATEKLADGIRRFSTDLDRLAQLIRDKCCG